MSILFLLFHAVPFARFMIGCQYGQGLGLGQASLASLSLWQGSMLQKWMKACDFMQ